MEEEEEEGIGFEDNSKVLENSAVPFNPFYVTSQSDRDENQSNLKQQFESTKRKAPSGMDNLVQSTVLGIKKGSLVEDMLDQITLDQTNRLFQKAKETVLLDEAERKWQMKKQRQQRYCACTCL